MDPLYLLSQERVDAMKKYIVELTEEERIALESLIARGKVAAYKQCHARILLKADEGEQGPRWNDERIAEALEISVGTVERTRTRFVQEGLDATLKRKVQTNRPRKIDGEVEAHLIAQACSDPPPGRARWTLHLLADRMVELNIVDSLSHEAVRQTLKKTNLNHG